MDEKTLQDILALNYGIESPSLEFLREGGTTTYIVNGRSKYLLKVIGSAFSDTARQSASIMRYLEGNGFPVPKTILTKSGETIFETEADGEKILIVLMDFIDGDEPELEKCASEVGRLVGRFHQLMEEYPSELVYRDKEFFIGRYIEFLRKKKYPRISRGIATEIFTGGTCCRMRMGRFILWILILLARLQLCSMSWLCVT